MFTRLLTLFLMSASSVLCLHAQNGERKNVFTLENGCTLQCALESYYSNHSINALDTVCIQSCVFVKFRVDDTGHVLDVECNAHTPEFLSSFLRSFLKSTDEKWRVDNPKQVLLLPVVCLLFKGNCHLKDETLPGIIGMLQFEKDSTIFSRPSMLGYREELPLECILLNPVILQGKNR